MYSSPTACLVTSGNISDIIMFAKDTRQGCPLSPLLFHLAIETLSRFINNNLTLYGLKINDMILHSALFADNILIFTSNPAADMIAIMDIFKNFQTFSGFMINFSKSEILPLNSTKSKNWIPTSAFSVASHYITYLGFKIGKEPSTIYHLNFPPLFSKIKKGLEAWMNLPISLFGSCHLCKIISFARLLYPLQTIFCGDPKKNL